MNGKRNKYFQTMQERLEELIDQDEISTIPSYLHKMGREECFEQMIEFEENIYLENEAFTRFSDFLNKE